jgi:heme oxygenase
VFRDRAAAVETDSALLGALASSEEERHAVEVVLRATLTGRELWLIVVDASYLGGSYLFAININTRLEVGGMRTAANSGLVQRAMTPIPFFASYTCN